MGSRRRGAPGVPSATVAPASTDTVRRTVLPGGLRVVTEAMPTVRSATFGIWVGVGSRDETPSLAGATHYLEHLLFKGTRRRDALEISASVEAVGGEMNAFTAKEYTCYYARVLDADLPLAIDVVCDMVTSSLVRSADVDSERGVILEEIAMHDDDPADLVHDSFAAALYGAGPLGRPVLGTTASIEGLSRTAIAGYYRRRYRPPHLVVAAAGNLRHDDVVRQVEAAFAAAGALADTAAEPAPPRAGGRAAATGARSLVVTRPTEQANLMVGVPAVSRTDDRRWALNVLNAAVGGGMSSRLFQEIREKRGLAYSVYSYTAQYADTGLFAVYAGCMPNRVDEVLALCRAELAAVAEHGIGAEELARGQGQVRGGLVLGLEDTSSRMSRIGKNELVYGELMSVDEVLDHIAAVTVDDVRAVARDLLAAPETLAVVGPFDEDREFGAGAA